MRGDLLMALVMRSLRAVLLAFLLGAGSSAVVAEEVVPGILYNLGTKFDGSFQEAAYRGMVRFREETGIDFMEFEPTAEAQRQQAIRGMVRRGANVIVALSFAQVSTLEAMAPELPDVKFVLIDGYLEAPNVQSVLFKEHEGAYLVGLLAAMASKSNKLGFVGGMDIPLIRKFACGYEQGVKSVNPDAEVQVNMVGNDHSAWNDPTKANELARSQIERGADVIFAPAGNSSLGVFQAAKDAGRYAIGSDSNQNPQQPGTVLTSMMKRVDLAVEGALRAVREDRWQPGVQQLGIAEGALGWALDEHNRALISPEMEKRVESARAAIGAGEIAVVDYTAQGECEY